MMITAIVKFQLPAKISVEEARITYNGTASKYQNVPGLIRKYYLLSENGEIGGGIYLWETKKDAETFYSPEWKKFVYDKYGQNPEISFFNSPVVVDNILNQIISGT